MEKLTENLNIIQNLSNQPTENAEELKAKFDEAGNIIKVYLNDIVVPEIEKIIEDYITTTVFKKYQEDIEKSIQEKLTSFDSTLNSTNASINKKTDYSDFVLSTHNIGLSTNIQYGRCVANATYTKAGYIPLGIVGTYFPYDYYQQWALEQYRITSASNGSCTVEVTGKAGTAEGNKTYSTTVTLYILWVKVK